MDLDSQLQVTFSCHLGVFRILLREMAGGRVQQREELLLFFSSFRIMVRNIRAGDNPFYDDTTVFRRPTMLILYLLSYY